MYCHCHCHSILLERHCFRRKKLAVGHLRAFGWKLFQIGYLLNWCTWRPVGSLRGDLCCWLGEGSCTNHPKDWSDLLEQIHPMGIIIVRVRQRDKKRCENKEGEQKICLTCVTEWWLTKEERRRDLKFDSSRMIGWKRLWQNLIGHLETTTISWLIEWGNWDCYTLAHVVQQLARKVAKFSRFQYLFTRNTNSLVHHGNQFTQNAKLQVHVEVDLVKEPQSPVCRPLKYRAAQVCHIPADH